MDNNPLVSIITPSYNQGQYIKHTIESVLNQTYTNIEYIVVDGGSTDNTIDILKGYGEKVKWISEEDDGQSDAINKGFKMAKGQIVAWLNSDDTYEKNAVETAVNYLSKYEEVALVYGHGHILDQNNNKISKFRATQEFDLYVLMYFWDYIMQPTTFFRKYALEKVGFLNTDLHYCMDWDLWIKLAINYKVGFINEFIANSREYESTKTASGGYTRYKEIKKLMCYYTKEKYPVGAISYLGSTIEMWLKNKPKLTKIGNKIARIMHLYALKTANLITKDGWFGKKCYFVIPPCQNGLKVGVKPIVGKKLPTKITIKKQGKYYKKIDVKGLSEIEIDLPNTNGTLLKYSLQTKRVFRPSNLSTDSQDFRKLSFLISYTRYY